MLFSLLDFTSFYVNFTHIVWDSLNFLFVILLIDHGINYVLILGRFVFLVNMKIKK